MINDDILYTEDHNHEAPLQLQLGPPPVSPLVVVPESVIVLHLNPLRDGTILLYLLGPEGFEVDIFYLFFLMKRIKR